MKKTNQIISNNIVDNDIQEYKICAGKDCNNKGKYCLKILYIKKSGWFCDYCKNDLQSYGLVEQDLEQESSLFSNNGGKK